MAHSHNSIASNFNCRVLAIKQPHDEALRPMIPAVAVLDSSTNMDFSQIDISRLQLSFVTIFLTIKNSPS